MWSTGAPLDLGLLVVHLVVYDSATLLRLGATRSWAGRRTARTILVEVVFVTVLATEWRRSLVSGLFPTRLHSTRDVVSTWRAVVVAKPRAIQFDNLFSTSTVAIGVRLPLVVAIWYPWGNIVTTSP